MHAPYSHRHTDTHIPPSTFSFTLSSLTLTTALTLSHTISFSSAGCDDKGAPGVLVWAKQKGHPVSDSILTTLTAQWWPAFLAYDPDTYVFFQTVGARPQYHVQVRSFARAHLPCADSPCSRL